MKTTASKKAMLASSILTIILFCNSSFSLTAQNPVWSLPNKYYDVVGNAPFSLPTGPNPIDYTGGVALRSHNSMLDANGNLLFFIVDGTVYDGDGYFIDEMKAQAYYAGLIPVIGSPELCIVPDPGNCNRYYIFSGASELVSIYIESPPSYVDYIIQRSLYAILDMSQQNNNQSPPRFGAFEYDMSNTYNAFVLNGDPFSPSSWFNYAASMLRPDNSRFVFAYHGKGTIYRYKITGTGIASGYASTTAPGSPGGPFQIQHSEMELFDPADGGNYKIACAGNMNVGSSTHAIYTAELDYATGNLVPGSEQYFYFYDAPEAKIHGLEFSANGNYLYITHEINSSHPGPIEYIDLTIPAPIVTPIATSIIPAGEAANFDKSFIERGLDGNMYFVNDNRFAKLSGTDNPATFIPAGFPTSSWTNTVTSISSPPYNFQTQVSGDGLTAASYTLPDQIDGMDYSAHFNTVQCCLASNPYDADNYTATTNATWSPGLGNNPFNADPSGNVYIRNKLTIPAGVTITITGMNFYFLPDAWVEVSRGNGILPGGKLILNNTKLSVDDRCNSGQLMWRGVEVHGYQTLSQLPYSNTQQGKIEVNNNSLVENALTGILASAVILGSYDFTYDGGIIRGTNSTFRNNRYDIIMRKYIFGTIANQSRFTNCTFVTDAALNIPTLFPVYHVYLNDLLNINFNGCDFRNDYATDATPAIQLGIGIQGVDAKFTVQNHCNCWACPVICPPDITDNSNFKNLRYGIAANNSNPLRTVTCTDANFTNNRRGIFLRGVNFAVITKNIFNIYKAALPNATTIVYGLYLQRCTGYKVQENYFQDINHSITDIGNSWGVIVDNSGPLDNEIYKNTFSNLKISGQSQGQNANPLMDNLPGQSGLRWRCNTFNDEITYGDLVITSGRIAYDQGYCTGSSLTPAGNLFNHDPLDPNWEIIASSSVPNFYYRHHFASAPNYFKPIHYTPNPPVFVNDCSPVDCMYGGVQCCPSKLGSTGIETRIAEIIGYRTQIAAKKNLIDGGSTSNLLAYINSPSNSIGQKKNMLLSKSPYLSDEVLIAYLNINTPPGHLQQVLLANSGITNEVWEVVVLKGLPNGIKKSINTARSTLSLRAQLYQQIGGLNAAKSYNIYEVVGYYLRDTISVSPLDSIIAILSQEEDRAFLEMLCNVNIEKGALAEASNIKNELVAAYGADNTTKMIELNIDLEPLPSKCFGIITNPDLRDKTMEIAYDENDKLTQVYARVLLTLAYDSIFPEIIEEIMIANSMLINANNNSDEVLPSIIKIYPNPALEELYIEAITNTNSTEVWSFMMVTVTDMQGRVLITKNNPDGWTFLTLALGNIQAGNYIVKVSDIWGNFEVKTFVKVQ